MLQRTLLILILFKYVSGELVQLAPSFLLEPASVVRYAAASGVRVRCVARGDPAPALVWLTAEGAQLGDTPGIRRIHSNGTLEMMPTAAYQVAANTVRCRASNAHGVAISRDITLQPVPDVNWEAVMSAESAAEGGVGALSCRGSEHAALVMPAVWYRGDRVLNVDTPTPDSRYIVAGNMLLIREVNAGDAGPYSCLARHTLTSSTKRSRPIHLTVTPSTVNSAPRLLSSSGEVSVPAGTDFCMSCVASEHPPPHYTWYREWNGRLQPVEATSSVWQWAGGAALCFSRAAPTSSGAWLCKAYNVFGDATAQMRLDVQDTLIVAVAPIVVKADTGSTVRFNCTASDSTASLSWVHEGGAVGGASGGTISGAGGELIVRGVTRAHRGVYQCFARRAHDSAQAAAELRLGDSAPELHYTFIEQALRPGGSVSLRCAASGSPPPRLSWLLDAQPLDQYRTHHRYFISEEQSVNGDVVSILNITSVTAGDGGRYTCHARNELGHAEHSARLNIYGPPSIRALGPVRVVAGANATIYCPYAGYPISSISWWRRGASVAVSGAGRVSARGAALRLAPALTPDAGHYACAVAAPQGPAARRDIEIQVRNPPKISPFMFSSELTEGSSVQVLCGVSSGDKPMYFSWLKDDAPIPPNLQIEEKSLNEFSLLMFSDLTALHSGEYTCRVSNHAATVNYTATLSVKVAPSWVTEPLDSAVLLGAPLLLECAAKGYPTPTVTWFRKIGGEGLGGDNDAWEPAGGTWGAGPQGDVVGISSGARAGSLSASAAARRHQGVYRCTADNGVGPPLVKHVNITVHEPAQFEGVGSNVSCVRGHSATLSCIARGDAPLALHWTHSGSRIDLNSYRWTVSEVRTGEGLRSTLQLRAAERADAGEYRCHAHNQYGRSELLMYLHVEEPPQAPRDVRLDGSGARWVRLAWRASSANQYAALYAPLHALPAPPPPTVHNLTLDPHDDRLDVDGFRSLSARLDGLKPASAYSLRLTASNHVGQSPPSDPLMFTTLEEAPSTSPQNVRVRPASFGELHISWSAPPRDSWNGELLGYVATWRELGRFEDSSSSEHRAGRLTSPGWSSVELTVSGLRAFARYAIAMRAFNRAGAGPSSPIVYATTSDGVPEEPPSSVSCENLSARSLRVRWSPPPAAQAHALKGYDVLYASISISSSWNGASEMQTARASASGEATLQGLFAATNYSVWVRARTDVGLGPPSEPIYCTTREDIPDAVETVRALAAGADAVRVTWLAPARAPSALTHYTLYTRELGKSGGEWAQRVDARAGEQEVWREVRGLRAAVYELWVRAVTAAGPGAPSRPVTAAPAPPVSARISSFSRVIYAVRGTRVRLKCSAVGTPPIRWRWSPLPPAHTVTDTGDLIIHKVELNTGGNYTCSVRNAGGADTAVFVVAVRAPPAAPAPRLLRADTHALHLAWDPPPDGGAALLGYTVHWSREGAGGEGIDAVVRDAGGTVRVVGGEAALTLGRLACGAPYRVTVRAHNAIGASLHSAPLLARTRGDKAQAALGKEFVWANSSALRLNLLAWRARCPVAAWRLALRLAASASAAPAPWTTLNTDGESAEATNLRPATWYEIRAEARSPAGDTSALYRAATLALSGERIGEPIEVAVEGRTSVQEIGSSGTSAGSTAWRTGLAPLLLGGGLATLVAALTGLIMVRRRIGGSCLKRDCSLHQACQPHPQLYTTEPSKRNGKTLTPPDGDLEISPYATFSMSGGGPEGTGAGRPGGTVGGAGCALHLHTFGRAESLDLAAPPPRPNLLSHTSEYGRCRDSDSESSGSPCAACAAELYRLPAAHLSDTLPAVESSAEDTSYSACGRGSRQTGAGRGERGERIERSERSERGARQAARGKRRREHTRHSSGPTVRYFSPIQGATRRDVL